MAWCSSRTDSPETNDNETMDPAGKTFNVEIHGRKVIPAVCLIFKGHILSNLTV